MFNDFIKLCICIILVCIVVIVISYTNDYTNDRNTLNNDSTSRIEEIKENLKDSITVITVKENEEVNIVRSASNDSTLIIFKKLVSE